MGKVKIFFKHLLMISLVAISLVTIFIIIESMLFIFGIEIGSPYTGYVFAFYMDYLIHFYIISLFLFSSILYFFYIKNKLKWLLGSVAVVYAIPIIWAGIIYFYDTVYSSRLPEQFTEYQDIENPVLEFKNKEIKLLAEGYVDLNQYLSPQNNLTVRFADAAYGDRITHVFYKFDCRGNLIAKFYPGNAEELLLRGYLINVDKEYYRSWAFDDDTLKRKIKIYNKEFSFNSIKQNAFLTDIEKKADFIFSEYCYIPGENSKSYIKVIYLKDNKWNLFYYDDDTETTRDREIKYKGEGYDDLFSPHLRLIPPYHPDSYIDRWDESNASKNIQSQYFQKTERHNSGYGKWFSVYGLRNSSEPQYDGYLYTNVIVDKDTLKIKELLSIDSENIIKYYPFSESDKSPRYLYYSNPNLEYQLLTNQSEKLYMIKNK